MTICEYCKKNNMSKEEYINFKNNIKVTAKAIRSKLTYKSGMYYPVSELFNWNSDPNMKCFIINELKKMNIEFFDNDTLYRVVD